MADIIQQSIRSTDGIGASGTPRPPVYVRRQDNRSTAVPRGSRGKTNAVRFVEQNISYQKIGDIIAQHITGPRLQQQLSTVLKDQLGKQIEALRAHAQQQLNNASTQSLIQQLQDAGRLQTPQRRPRTLEDLDAARAAEHRAMKQNARRGQPAAPQPQKPPHSTQAAAAPGESNKTASDQNPLKDDDRQFDEDAPEMDDAGEEDAEEPTEDDDQSAATGPEGPEEEPQEEGREEDQEEEPQEKEEKSTHDDTAQKNDEEQGEESGKDSAPDDATKEKKDTDSEEKNTGADKEIEQEKESEEEPEEPATPASPEESPIETTELPDTDDGAQAAGPAGGDAETAAGEAVPVEAASGAAEGAADAGADAAAGAAGAATDAGAAAGTAAAEGGAAVAEAAAGGMAASPEAAAAAATAAAALRKIKAAERLAKNPTDLAAAADVIGPPGSGQAMRIFLDNAWWIIPTAVLFLCLSFLMNPLFLALAMTFQAIVQLRQLDFAGVTDVYTILKEIPGWETVFTIIKNGL